MKKKLIFNQETIETAVNTLIPLFEKYHIFALSGPLGAGKTTLVRHLLRRMNVIQPVQSPTFTYMNLYTSTANDSFYHFDLYRIATIDEFYASGFDEYIFGSQTYCFIEWPEVIAHQLASSEAVCFLGIDYQCGTQDRIMTVSDVFECA